MLANAKAADTDNSYARVRARHASLRLRLMGLVIFALLPVVIVLVIVTSQRRNQAIELMQQNTLILARLAAANQQQLISGARDILITLAQVPAIKNNDRQACLFFLTNILMQHPLYANFGAANREGEIFCMTLPQRVPVNIKNKTYFRDAIHNLDFAISAYQIDPVNSQAKVTLAYPVLDEAGKPQGIVFAELDLRWLYQFISAAALPTGAQLRAIDLNGTTLALYPSGEEAIGKPMYEVDVANKVIIQNEGILEGTDAAGVGRLYAFTPLHAAAGPEVYMIVDIPTEAILAGPTHELILSLVALAVGASLALVAAWFGSKWLILRQVNDLVHATRRLSKGDLSIRAHGAETGDELSELAKSFNEMADALQQREAQHLHSQAQIRKQTRQAKALARIAGQLNAHLELETVVEAVCDEVSRLMNVPSVSVRLCNFNEEDTEHLYGELKHQPATHEEVGWLPMRVFHGRVGLGSPQIFTVGDFGNFPVAEPHSELQQKISQVIVAAMVHEEALIGYLNLFSYHELDIGEDELTLLQGIAAEAALAVTNARLYQALQNEERTRARLLSNLITAQEDERMRIARELHDETSQSLTALLVGFDVLRMAAKAHPEHIEGHLRDQKMITEELLNNIHRLIIDLRPSLLDDLGLAPAITWYGDLRLSMCGIEFDIACDDLSERLPRSVETALFRIVQEAITNVIRHSQASMVNLCMIQQSGYLVLQISDNGCGFDPVSLQNPKRQQGFGLRGMMERTAMLGGTFTVDSTPERGTHITVALPVANFEALNE